MSDVTQCWLCEVVGSTVRHWIEFFRVDCDSREPETIKNRGVLVENRSNIGRVAPPKIVLKKRANFPARVKG